jgi:hypothetical protein
VGSKPSSVPRSTLAATLRDGDAPSERLRRSSRSSTLARYPVVLLFACALRTCAPARREVDTTPRFAVDVRAPPVAASHRPAFRARRLRHLPTSRPKEPCSKQPRRDRAVDLGTDAQI